MLAVSTYNMTVFMKTLEKNSYFWLKNMWSPVFNPKPVAYCLDVLMIRKIS